MLSKTQKNTQILFKLDGSSQIAIFLNLGFGIRDSDGCKGCIEESESCRVSQGKESEVAGRIAKVRGEGSQVREP